MLKFQHMDMGLFRHFWPWITTLCMTHHLLIRSKWHCWDSPTHFWTFTMTIGTIFLDNFPSLFIELTLLFWPLLNPIMYRINIGIISNFFTYCLSSQEQVKAWYIYFVPEKSLEYLTQPFHLKVQDLEE